MTSVSKNPTVRRTLKLLSELPLVEIDDRYSLLDSSRDFKMVFLNSDEGKRVLSQMLDMVPVLGDTHVFNNPEGSAYNSGKKALLLEILSHILYDETIDGVER